MRRPPSFYFFVATFFFGLGFCPQSTDCLLSPCAYAGDAEASRLSRALFLQRSSAGDDDGARMMAAYDRHTVRPGPVAPPRPSDALGPCAHAIHTSLKLNIK